MVMPRIGIIGGSGLYQIDGLRVIEKTRLTTPFGSPSDEFVLGELEGREVVFLPRHGRGHRLLPVEINNRANIFGFKTLQVEQILSVSTVGSLKVELKPLDIVLIDQLVDRTNQARPCTFFGEGIAAHISFAQPFCPSLRKAIHQQGLAMSVPVKWGGTYVNIEGPAFSTLAESMMHRAWGMDVVGMTQMAEAKLAREAEICYATMALVTDYDCWRETETLESVTADMVIETMKKGIATARELIRLVVRTLPAEGGCSCTQALSTALVTDRSAWPEATIKKLGPIIQKYL
jgi:5'-methylthioadenosine phosphorylase